MSRVQKCRNGCGTDIQVMQDLEGSGKWKPYEQDENGEPRLHDCPKSPYNLKKQQSATAPQQEESSVQYQILQELRKANSLLAKIAGVED